jgi:DNA-binding transcriptional regulator YiaG
MFVASSSCMHDASPVMMRKKKNIIDDESSAAHLSSMDPVDKLKEWLEEPGRTQQELADRCGVRIGTVWRWVHRKSVPAGAAAARLEQELGIPAASWWEL